MTKLIWNQASERPYEYGVDRGVFYPKAGTGTAWNGLVAVNETTVDASQTLIYIDGVGHQNQMLIGSFAAVIEAITYPDEFEPFDGYSGIYSAQSRRLFDFCYRTMQANGHYKIHLVYNALATPTDRNHASFNATKEVELFSWDLTTKNVVVPGAKASSHFVVDTTQVNPGLILALEQRLYGTEASLADMPAVTELLAIFEEYAVFRVTDHGDGSFTVTGPDDVVYLTDPTTFVLSWPSVNLISSDTYQATSL